MLQMRFVRLNHHYEYRFFVVGLLAIALCASIVFCAEYVLVEEHP